MIGKNLHRAMRQTACRVCALLLLVLLSPQVLYALDGEGTKDKPYLIYNVEDYKAFASHANSHQLDVCAVLCADLDLGNDVIVVGTSLDMPYSGVFDGNYHQMTINFNSPKENYGSPFPYVAGAHIKNLYIKGNIHVTTPTIGTSVAGVAGYAVYRSVSRIENVISEVDIRIDDDDRLTIGGIVGYTNGDVEVLNCGVLGQTTLVKPRAYGGIVGFIPGPQKVVIKNSFVRIPGEPGNKQGGVNTIAYGLQEHCVVENCYSTQELGEMPNGAQLADEDEIASGELCWKLNGTLQDGIWRQTMSEDTIPMPDPSHKMVFKEGYKYVNLEIEGTGTEQDPFIIKDAKDYKTFSTIINSGSAAHSHARLAADIDLGKNFIMIGHDTPFSGVFDGQGHTLRFQADRLKESVVAPFTNVAGATIRNLYVEGSIHQRDFMSAAGLISHNQPADRRTVVENVMVNVDFIVEEQGYSGTYAGIVQTSTGSLYLHNSAYIGRMHASLKGRFCGIIAENSATDGTLCVRDCYVHLTHVSDINPEKSYALLSTLHEKDTLDNVYATARFQDKFGIFLDHTAASSGELCMKLNRGDPYASWRQTFGKNQWPVFDVNEHEVFFMNNRYVNPAYINLESSNVFKTEYFPNGRSQIYGIFRALCENGQESVILNSNGTSGKLQLNFTTSQAHIQSGAYQANVPLTHHSSHEMYSVLWTSGGAIVKMYPQEHSSLLSTTRGIPADFHAETCLEVGSHVRLYELSVMENGALLHHYLPCLFDGKYGIYDEVTNRYFPIECTGYVNSHCCLHEHTIRYCDKGIEAFRCEICNTFINPTYYVKAVFDANGGLGQMPVVDDMRAGDRLPANRYKYRLHEFDGWEALSEDGKPLGRTFHDGDPLPVDSAFRGTIIFRAKWADCLTYNGKTMRITEENTRDIKIVDGAEHHPFGAARDFTAAAISYTHTVAAGSHWGTLCLPFAVTAPSQDVQLFGEAKIEKVKDGVEVITLKECTSLEAGQPGLFYLTGDASKERSITLAAQNAAVKAAPHSTTQNGLTLTGTFEGEAFECAASKIYYGVQKDYFYNVGTSYVVHPFRMYMTMPRVAGAQSRYMISWDETTSVESMEEDAKDAGTVYDLSGRRVRGRLIPGLYIINGNKVVIK